MVRRFRRLGVEEGRGDRRLPVHQRRSQLVGGQLLRVGDGQRHVAPGGIGIHPATGGRGRVRTRRPRSGGPARRHRHELHTGRPWTRCRERRRRPQRVQRGRDGAATRWSPTSPTRRPPTSPVTSPPPVRSSPPVPVKDGRPPPRIVRLTDGGVPVSGTGPASRCHRSRSRVRRNGAAGRSTAARGSQMTKRDDGIVPTPVQDEATRPSADASAGPGHDARAGPGRHGGGRKETRRDDADVRGRCGPAHPGRRRVGRDRHGNGEPPGSRRLRCDRMGVPRRPPRRGPGGDLQHRDQWSRGRYRGVSGTDNGTGTGVGVLGTVTNPENSQPAVYGFTQGRGPGVQGESDGPGPGVLGTDNGTGTGYAVYGELTNPRNTESGRLRKHRRHGGRRRGRQQRGRTRRLRFQRGYRPRRQGSERRIATPGWRARAPVRAPGCWP